MLIKDLVVLQAASTMIIQAMIFGLVAGLVLPHPENLKGRPGEGSS